MENNIILNVQIGSPVTNFRCTSELEHFQDRVIIAVMQNNTLLVFIKEGLIC